MNTTTIKYSYTLRMYACCSLLFLIHAMVFAEDSAAVKRVQGDLRDAAGQTAAWTGTASVSVSPAPKSITKTKIVEVEDSIESLALAGLSIGKKIKLEPSMVKYFGMPSGPEDLTAQQVIVPLENGRSKGLVVRRRSPGHFDIIIVENITGKGTYFYSTSQSGQLQKAVFADKGKKTALSNKEAEKTFKAELAFWRQWETEANRSSLASNDPAAKPEQ